MIPVVDVWNIHCTRVYLIVPGITFRSRRARCFPAFADLRPSAAWPSKQSSIPERITPEREQISILRFTASRARLQLPPTLCRSVLERDSASHGAAQWLIPRHDLIVERDSDEFEHDDAGEGG